MSKANRGTSARIARKGPRLAKEAAEREVRIAAINAERAGPDDSVVEGAMHARAEAEGPSADPSADPNSSESAIVENSSGPFTAQPEDIGERLDHFVAAKLPDVSRSRVQMLMEQGKLSVTDSAGAPLEESKLRPSYRLRGGEQITVLGRATPPPLRARAENLPIDIVYEDDDLAVLNKASGMVVHAGAGSEEDDERGSGTVVNAILHHFQQVANSGDPVRPGIVHRLDKLTSGLLVIAKNDAAHVKLAEAFAERTAKKQYIALVHGNVERDTGTVNLPISRDQVRRTRMTVRQRDGRNAVTRWKVRERLTTAWGDFTLLDVTIETGRTHQIRVHMSSTGHPIVGDSLYGAPHELRPRELQNQPAKKRRRAASQFAAPLRLDRNFLHAAKLALPHPRTGEMIAWHAPLAPELEEFLRVLKE